MFDVAILLLPFADESCDELERGRSPYRLMKLAGFEDHEDRGLVLRFCRALGNSSQCPIIDGFRRPCSSALLLVTMPKTPNESDPRGAESEGKIIQEAAKGLSIVRMGELASVKIILDNLTMYNIVLFATLPLCRLSEPLPGRLNPMWRLY